MAYIYIYITYIYIHYIYIYILYYIMYISLSLSSPRVGDFPLPNYLATIFIYIYIYK